MNYYIAGKFGGELNLVVWRSAFVTAKLKSTNISYIRMTIPYPTAKFKSANIFAMAILGPTTKFNSRQYFRLYGSLQVGDQPPVLVCGVHPKW